MSSSWPSSIYCSTPVSVFQTLHVLSLLAVMILLPCGLNWIFEISFSCPSKSAVHAPVNTL